MYYGKDRSSTDVHWEIITVTWALVIALMLVIIAVLSYRAINNDMQLQVSYNKSIVACIQAGGKADECERALTVRSN